MRGEETPETSEAALSVVIPPTLSSTAPRGRNMTTPTSMTTPTRMTIRRRIASETRRRRTSR
jgi:hypothetical protein